MISDAMVERVFETVKWGLASGKRRTVSTYRLQFNRSFTFRDAATLVPYLHRLGITDIYASPYLRARPGSMHGYDISDHNSLNPEIGSEDDYRELVNCLHRYGMGQVLDFVPNHMGMVGNPWWIDVLENGPASPYARFFDIDWYPIKAELRQKVLLPILEDQYGRVLQEGMLHLVYDQGGFWVTYWEHELPIDPATASLLLVPCISRLRESLGAEHPDYLEMQSIITACNNLPARSESSEERVNERQREKEIVKKRLHDLRVRNKDVQTALDEVLEAFNGNPGVSASFDRLHELLEAQAYRLTYWRVASDEINYRRFFDINNLVAIHMEDPRVFDLSHRLLRQLLREDAVTGLRIDHVDGLLAPDEYLWRLQKAYFLELCWKEISLIGPSLASHSLWQGRLSELFDRERERNPESAGVRPLFIVVEKILGEKETLREDWPVDGTTGYEFADLLNGIFINRRNARAVRHVYWWFTGNDEDFRDIAYQCKNLIMRTTMSAEVNVIAHQLDRVSEKSRWYRDFTLNSLRDAIREVVACFPVYRTYIDAFNDTVTDRDRAIISTAVGQAKRRNPAVSASLFDFVRDTLLLKYPPDMDEKGRREQQLLVLRFQQLTGPVMAKGVEDTAFYVYNPLVSLNDVGGNPQRFGNTVDDFHRHNTERRKSLPRSLVTTSTHDSKRSEDVRARINVLSEIPQDWRAALARWRRLNRRKKTTLNDEPVPDRNEEYLMYQTLLGTYPLYEMDEEERLDYQERIQNYALKAIREAKVHTSWISPDTAYEEGVRDFVSGILDASSSNPFLADFLPLHRVVAWCGMYNSLAQTILKLFSPGTPDLYQGNELWDYSLVDPDNRRPVDFSRRVRCFEDLMELTGEYSDPGPAARQLVSRMESGEIKLYVTWRALTYRRENVSLFDEGAYVPLQPAGARRSHVCAFAWRSGPQELIVAVPRLLARLTRKATIPPLGTEAWGDTVLVLSGKTRARRYRNVFTGEIVETVAHADDHGHAGLSLADVFRTFPVAVLERATS